MIEFQFCETVDELYKAFASLLSTRPLSALTSVSIDQPLSGFGHPWPQLHVHREDNPCQLQ
jgi:hypothetical protein